METFYLSEPYSLCSVDQKINIHETAFVTAYFRAGDSALSGDKYAHLWANPIVANHAKRYISAVSAYEDYAHCLRNRYFYDTLKELIKKENIEVLINFGCGFSMYPFLLDASLHCIEIDMADVIAYKKEKTEAWQKEGLLPCRNITFLEADFNAPSLQDLYKQLEALKSGKRSFILLEGVLFFLGKSDTIKLFDLFNRLQGPEEFLASVSFQPQLEKQAVFKKLIDFVEGNLEKNQQFDYQTVPDSFYKDIEGYTLMDHQHTFSLSARYLPENKLPFEEILNEHMYLLQKNVNS
ncbi:class I SAM-dependent methyltransferase [uncultured Muriicola sp.]|uniref:class I SAM-dependent methyltransferase n=1 Tax=uncultured Muriicola sp. TaxID=1583102 RepID=UPI0026275B41|nr:class I SAM-dependent methyltransferase [uncultured Muriicola sp.]